MTQFTMNVGATNADKPEAAIAPKKPAKRSRKATRKADSLEAATPPERGSPEGVVAYIKQRLLEHPPAPHGSEPLQREARQAGTLRSSRIYFPNTEAFPNGIEVGGNEIYNRNQQGKWVLAQFRADISPREMEVLDCYANGRHFLTDEERAFRRKERDIRLYELKRYGREVTTSTPEEQALAAIAKVSDPAMKAALLEAAAKSAREAAGK